MTWPPWKTTRDVALFVGGLAGIAYETLAGHVPRESLLVVFAAMMGLPAFLRSDEAKKAETTKPEGGPVITDHDRAVAQHVLDLLNQAAKAVAKPIAKVRDYPQTAVWAAGTVLLALVAR